MTMNTILKALLLILCTAIIMAATHDTQIGRYQITSSTKHTWVIDTITGKVTGLEMNIYDEIIILDSTNTQD